MAGDKPIKFDPHFLAEVANVGTGLGAEAEPGFDAPEPILINNQPLQLFELDPQKQEADIRLDLLLDRIILALLSNPKHQTIVKFPYDTALTILEASRGENPDDDELISPDEEIDPPGYHEYAALVAADLETFASDFSQNIKVALKENAGLDVVIEIAEPAGKGQPFIFTIKATDVARA